MKKYYLSLIVLLVAIIPCCAKSSKKDAFGMNFRSVSMDEGLKLMSQDKDYVLLDVRRPAEYAEGHIPGAILHTNELMTKENTELLLKNKDQTIYVYCRSGRRSKEASKKLVSYGYTNVIEIGGINDYSGELRQGL